MFPRVEVVLKGPQADRERQAERDSRVRQIGPSGRKDMQYFFNWLYEKGVRHIIRVSVEDSGASGEKVHSDQAIQKSLERFIVEQLDWKKTDLDPETILSIGNKAVKEPPSWKAKKSKPETKVEPQLRQLCLRWSGSNTVLRGWSEPGGLAKLPHLRQIRLFLPPADKVRALSFSSYLYCVVAQRTDGEKTYDNEQWIEAKVEEFQNRLHTSQEAYRQAQTQLQLADTPSNIPGAGGTSGMFYPVEVRIVNNRANERGKEAPHGLSHVASGPVKTASSHQWLECTARFAGEMTTFWDKTVKDYHDSIQNRPTADGPESDVVVALIDDGINKFDPLLEANQVLDGKSFDFHDGMVKPFYSSTRGHGTIMASMILRVCPMAKIYPIRLKTFDDSVEGKNMRIDAGYAAQVCTVTIRC